MCATSISSLTPSLANEFDPATIDVVGTDFLGAYTVTFDGSPVTQDNVTTTSFSIDIVAPTVGLVPIVVTLPNGQMASQSLLVTSDKRIFVASTT